MGGELASLCTADQYLTLQHEMEVEGNTTMPLEVIIMPLGHIASIVSIPKVPLPGNSLLLKSYDAP